MRREVRRRFTAPFVMIISAGSAGCSKGTAPETPPPRSDLGTTWYVMKRGEGCSAMEENHCPPNVMCNPPPPRPIACPAGAAEDTGVRVTELTAGSCAIVPPGCDARGCATTPTACPDPWPTAPAAPATTP